jgi:hypothetical protein
VSEIQGQDAILGMAIAETRGALKQLEIKLRATMQETMSRRADIAMIPLVRRAAWLCEGILEVSNRD